MERIFVLLCALGVALSKPGFRFGTQYGTNGVLSYVPGNIVSVTPRSYTMNHPFGNSHARNTVPVFVSSTPPPRHQVLQFSPSSSYYSPVRRQNQPPRISDTIFGNIPGFISSTASPPFFGGPSFGTTSRPTLDSTNNAPNNPIPVEVLSPSLSELASIDPVVPVAQSNGPIVNKYFYLHAAPEESDMIKHQHFTIGKPQQTYRIIFIKAPSANGQAKISASFAPKEEKTVIYVLSKKPNQVEIKDIVTPPPTEPSRPEVVFIKYKTNEEAVHAQQTIQAQYDQLGGSSQVSDEGIAPVTSVIGILGDTEEAAQNTNEISNDAVVRVTPTPVSDGIYPLNQQYRVLEARSVE